MKPELLTATVKNIDTGREIVVSMPFKNVQRMRINQR